MQNACFKCHHASTALSSLHVHFPGPTVHRAQVRGHGPANPGRGSAPESALPAPRHLFLLLTAQGLPRRLFHRTGGRTKRGAVAGPGAADTKTPALALGPGGVRAEEPDARGCARRASGWPKRVPRAGHPTNEIQRSACARASGDCRVTDRGRLAESRAVDEIRGRLGAEVPAGATGSGRHPQPVDRLTAFDRSRRSCGEDLVAMELGELLYNKSEYIETVRVPEPRPSRLQAGVPWRPRRPSSPLPHPGGALWRVGTCVSGLVIYSSPGRFRLSKISS